MKTENLDGFTICPATWDDFESVLSLIAQQNIANYGEPMISAETLRDSWQSPQFDLATNTRLVVTPNQEIACYAELHTQSPASFYVFIYVAADYQNQGIAATLLRWAENQVQLWCVDQTSVRLKTRLSERNREGRQIFGDAGYEVTLSFIIMEIVMDTPPQMPRWAESITVRSFVAGQDEHATYLADEEASEDKGYHSPMTFDEWAKRMGLQLETFDPELWFLAESNGKLAGVALNVYSRETNTGWIDHLGVRRSWRNLGIGKALLLHSFGAFYQRGIYRVRLSVDSQSLTGAPRLYEKAGMQMIQQYHIYGKELK